MDEILHLGALKYCNSLRWCKISSINSIRGVVILEEGDYGVSQN